VFTVNRLFSHFKFCITWEISYTFHLMHVDKNGDCYKLSLLHFSGECLTLLLLPTTSFLLIMISCFALFYLALGLVVMTYRFKMPFHATFYRLMCLLIIDYFIGF